MAIPCIMPWPCVPPALFCTPHRPTIPLERHVDPVTGATILRHRKSNQRTNSNSAGVPVPCFCNTVGCTLYGQPHEMCAKGRKRSTYCSKCGRNCSCPGGPRVRFQPVNPRRTIHGDAIQENAFRRWLASRPNAHLPRNMPPNWTAPSQFRPLPNVVFPAHIPYAPVAGQYPWQQQPGINIIPPIPANVTSWNCPPSTTCMGVPLPWLAHPQPHPHIPAQQFWQYTPAAVHPILPWVGPSGQPVTPTALMNPNLAYVVTGGHPLPGQDTTWTPATAWMPLPALIGQPAGATPAPGVQYQPGTVMLAPWLIANPRNSVVPHILWDTAIDPPSGIKRLTGRGDIVDLAGTPALETQATYPGTDEIVVMIPKMRTRWGPVKVSKKSGKPHVRVCDIYEAVYAYLHTRLSHEDLASIVYSPDGGGMERYRRIEYECWRRCANSHALPEYQRQQGFKRVDLLEGLTVFWGMWPCYTADGRWYLSLSFCPSQTRTL